MAGIMATFLFAYLLGFPLMKAAFPDRFFVMNFLKPLYSSPMKPSLRSKHLKSYFSFSLSWLGTLFLSIAILHSASVN